MSINKKQFTDIRKAILDVIPELHNTGTSIIVGNNKLSCKNGLVKFSDPLGITEKNFTNYYYEVNEPGFLTSEDLIDLNRAIKKTKKYR